MFGRVRRPSMSSLVQLELERPPPKIIKDDPFSIYETTLRKLKEGSNRCQSLPSVEAASTDYSHIASCCSGTMNLDCSSYDCSHDSSICQSMSFSKDKGSDNISVLYFFSKYKIARSNPILPDKEAMVIDNAYSPFSTPTLNECQLPSSSEQHARELH